MLLIGLLAGIRFQNSNIATVFLIGHGIHRQHTRLRQQRHRAHLDRIFHILLEIVRIDLNFRQTHNTILPHRFFHTHLSIHL